MRDYFRGFIEATIIILLIGCIYFCKMNWQYNMAMQSQIDQLKGKK